VFSSKVEVEAAYQREEVSLHAKIKVRASIAWWSLSYPRKNTPIPTNGKTGRLSVVSFLTA